MAHEGSNEEQEERPNNNAISYEVGTPAPARHGDRVRVWFKQPDDEAL